MYVAALAAPCGIDRRPYARILLRPQLGRLQGRQHCYQNFATRLYRTSNRHYRLSTFKMRICLRCNERDASRRSRASALSEASFNVVSRGLDETIEAVGMPLEIPFLRPPPFLPRERRAATQVRPSVARDHELAKRARKNWEARREVGSASVSISGSAAPDWRFW